MRLRNLALGAMLLFGGLAIFNPDWREGATTLLDRSRSLANPDWSLASEPAPLLIALLLLLALMLFLARRRRARRKAKSTSTTLPAVRMDAFDREFLPAALEIFETPPSPIRVAGIWFICVLFATALAWAYFGWLEIYAVAQGRIQPSGRSKVLQPLEAGKVVAVAVENGSRVAAGDLLVELDPREAAADHKEQERDLESARAEVARRRAAISAARASASETPAVAYPEGTGEEVRSRENSVLTSDFSLLLASCANLRAQRVERVAARDRLQASVASREKLLALYKERAAMLETLNQTKTASRAQLIEMLQQYETQATVQVGEKGQLGEVEASLTTLDRKLDETVSQFIADQMQKLEEAERRADHFKGELVKAAAKHERTRLTAPISGTVQQLAVTTVGQVVAPGQALLTIVPSDSPIEIEAMIQNQDIGFVEPGQPAVVKIESFPFTRYGTINGAVLKVSRDAVDEREAMTLSDPKSTVKPQAGTTTTAELPAGQNLVFPATISLSKWFINVDGKEIPLSPGMAVTVEIRTGQRRALDYILSPLREVTSSAGHER